MTAPLLFGGLLCGQSPAAPAAPEPKSVLILGASVSGGFSDQIMTPKDAADRAHNKTMRLQRALMPLWAADAVSIRDFSNVLMFQDPETYGRAQVDRAVKTKVDVVLAIDFPFWFGYSVRGGDKAARLELQRKGLDLLARIDAPILIGDYPELRDVDPRMLHPRAVPDHDTLNELNANLRAWAKGRQNVRMLSLAELITDLRETKRTLELDGKQLELDAADVMQTDRLHATRLGMAVLAQRVVEALTELAPAVTERVEVRDLPGILRRLDLVELACEAGLAKPVVVPAVVDKR